MSSYIEAYNVKFSYNDQEDNSYIEVLKGIDLKIKKGEFVALLGHNGCGKSTIAKHFNAILLPSGGKIFVDKMSTNDETHLYDIRRNVGLVLQNPDNQIVASVVEEDVAFGPENLGLSSFEIRMRVDKALKAVDMYDYKDEAPHKLSGGQKQRVAIAGIIAMKPSCIVLDEPTAMLDPSGRDEVMNTIKVLNKEKKITVVLITHFMEEAVLADRVVIMNDGKILMQGEPKEVFSNVDILRKYHLDVPQTTELIYELNKKGFNLRKDILTEDDCVNEISRLLETVKCR